MNRSKTKKHEYEISIEKDGVFLSKSVQGYRVLADSGTPGPLAVRRVVGTSVRGSHWNVDHLPTGSKFWGPFKKRNDAIEFSRRVYLAVSDVILSDDPEEIKTASLLSSIFLIEKEVSNEATDNVQQG